MCSGLGECEEWLVGAWNTKSRRVKGLHSASHVNSILLKDLYNNTRLHLIANIQVLRL